MYPPNNHITRWLPTRTTNDWSHHHQNHRQLEIRTISMTRSEEKVGVGGVKEPSTAAAPPDQQKNFCGHVDEERRKIFFSKGEHSKRDGRKIQLNFANNGQSFFYYCWIVVVLAGQQQRLCLLHSTQSTYRQCSAQKGI